MVNVKVSVEYKINVGDNSLVLNSRKYDLLRYIDSYQSLTKAGEQLGVSYRTVLNNINKIESNLGIKIVTTTKGGKGGGGGAILTETGFSILKECNKINAIMELHQNVNEIKTKVIGIDESKKVMTIKSTGFEINVPLNRSFKIGDDVLAMISYDNIVLMLKPQTTSIRNIFKGSIVEMKLEGEIIRVIVDVGGTILYCDITLSAEKELNLTIGKPVYVAFKAMSVATLKL